MIVWLGNPTRSSIKIVVKPSADGSVTFAIAGMANVSVTSSVSVLDGVVYREIAGLQPDTEYVVSVVQSNGESDTVYARTDPGAGATFQIGWAACLFCDQDAWWEDVWSAKCSNLRRRIFPGDTGYESACDAWGMSTPTKNTLANSSDSSIAYDKAEQFFLLSKLRAANKRVPIIIMVDDHWWPGDNFDFSVTQLNKPTSIGATTQAEVDAAYLAYDLAAQAYLQGNPANTSPLAIPQKAPTSNLIDSQFSVHYCSFDVGDLHVCINDHISGRSPIAQTDNASKYLMTPAQEEWTINDLKTSGKPLTAWVNPKNLFNKTPANADGWRVYQTQRNRILNAVLPYVSGMIVLTGDHHYPHSTLLTASHGLGGDLYEMCPSPASGPSQTQPQDAPDGYDDDAHTNIFRYKCGGYSGDKAFVFDGCGVLHVEQGKWMEATCYDRRGAARFRSGRIYPGSNIPLGRRPTVTRSIR